MKAAILFALAVAALGLGACASDRNELGGGSLGAFCAMGNRDSDLCKINDEITQTREQTAQAQATADAALRREDSIFCETRTFKHAQTGSCGPGYTLMTCTQTRYTSAAGRSIMRSMNDQSCRFAGKVLEMQVRCCVVGAVRAPSQPTDAPPPSAPKKQTKDRNV
jgi:hypothetical protein